MKAITFRKLKDNCKHLESLPHWWKCGPVDYCKMLVFGEYRCSRTNCPVWKRLKSVKEK